MCTLAAVQVRLRKINVNGSALLRVTDTHAADYPAFLAWTGRVADAIGPGYPVHPYGIDLHPGA